LYFLVDVIAVQTKCFQYRKRTLIDLPKGAYLTALQAYEDCGAREAVCFMVFDATKYA